MNIPKRHHYLPKFYLERFCREELLWVYDREKNEYRQQAPINTALESQFYTAVGPDGKEHVEIEKFFSFIEGETKPIIEKIDQGGEISLKDKEMIATFVSFLKVRVPDFEKTIDEANEKLLKKVNQFMFSTEEQAAALLKKVEGETGQSSSISPKDLVEFVKGDAYTVGFQREFYLSLMMEMGYQAIFFLLNMDWLFLQTPDSSSFVTSDSPFVLIPPINHDPKGFFGIGLLSPGAKKVIPLSKKTCLVICDRGERVVYGGVSRERVRKINLMIAHECDRFLIGRDRALLENLVGTTKIDQWKVEGRVDVS